LFIFIISQGYQYKCTGIIAFVFGVIFFIKSSVFIVKFSKFISTKTGLAQILVIAIAVAEYVFAGNITSSHFSTHKTSNHNCKAVVPEFNNLTYHHQRYSLIFFSVNSIYLFGLEKISL
jgi:hypothetical protein